MVHYNLPKSIENYYQEIGRGGRDGLPCETILFYNIGDIITLQRFAEESGQREINTEKLQRMQEYAESQVCRRRILLNYFGEISDKGCGNCDVCHTPPQTFDGTELVQKALSAILRTGEQIGFTLTIDILHGNFSPEVMSRGYNQIKTFAAGRDVPVRDWHDYLLQMLQMGFIEIAYNEDNHLHVTQLGKDVVHRKTRVQLVVISREDYSVKARRSRMMEEQVSAVTVSGQSENMELYERLKVLRKEIADEMNSPAFVVMSDKTLHALATDMPTTLSSFGNTFGIGEHKRDTYGERFIEVIKQFAPVKEELPFPAMPVTPDIPAETKEEKGGIQETTECIVEGTRKKSKNKITIQGKPYVIDEDIWESIEWRKVLKDITERGYWNYQGPLEIHLSDYVKPEIKHRDRIIAMLCRLLKEGYSMNVDEQNGVVTIAQKFDYDKDGQVVEFPSGSFDEILSRFRLFAIKNKRYPLMDGEHDEVALRKWYREVGHGLVKITDEQKVLFDNLSVEFANIPKHRGQLEKLAERDALSESDALFAREDIQTIDDEDEEEFLESEIAEQIELPDEAVIDEVPTSKKRKPLPKTIQVTLDLAKEGYSFDAIVSKRELSALTISKHLSYLILHGMVNVSDFVDSYAYDVILGIFEELPKGSTVKRVKSKCPEGIRRSTIRMVMADIKRKLQDLE